MMEALYEKVMMNNISTSVYAVGVLDGAATPQPPNSDGGGGGRGGSDAMWWRGLKKQKEKPLQTSCPRVN
jgi:hypothetical protein